MKTPNTPPSRLSLPRFRKILKGYASQLPSATYWRYSVGILPPNLRFLIENPDLIQALADDAQRLSQQSDRTHCA